MKKTIILKLFLIFNGVSLSSLAQISIWDKPAEMTLISPDWNFYRQLAETYEARYNYNRDYRDKLIEWVFNLKTQTDDSDFLNALNYQYNLLRNMDGKDFGALGKELDIIKQDIREEIDRCNSRAKDKPKRLWDSANQKLKDKYYSQAITDYSSLVEISPGFIYTYLNRGYAYYMIGEYQLAIVDFNKFISQIKDNSYAYSYRGWAHYYVDDNMSALKDFNNQINLDPNSELGYYNRGSVKSQLNDNLGAIDDYTKAINLKPDFSMAYNNRGWANYKLKKYSVALIDLNKSIELDNNNWVAYDSRQETKFMLNDLIGCIRDCDSAIYINPNCSNSYFYRGRAKFKSGNKIGACNDWSTAGQYGKSEAYDFITKYCK